MNKFYSEEFDILYLSGSMKDVEPLIFIPSVLVVVILYCVHRMIVEIQYDLVLRMLSDCFCKRR